MMDQKAIPDYFGNMTYAELLSTPTEQLDGEFAHSKSYIRVVKRKKVPTCQDMDKADAYTHAAFKHPEKGMNEYPPTPEAREKGIASRIGRPGCIYSRFHLEEKLSTHTALTVGLLDENWHKSYGHIAVPFPLIVAASYHDLGKKWCACTNAAGEISSYGHAQCSAYAIHQLLDGLVEDETREVISASIFGHDLIKRWTPDDEVKYDKYLYDIGENLRGRQNRMVKVYTEMIADADAGIKQINVDERNREVSYVITYEHFSKEDGRVIEKEKTLSVEEFYALVRKGYELIDHALAILRKAARTRRKYEKK